MKWDIDKSILELEPSEAAGTQFEHIYVQLSDGLKIEWATKIFKGVRWTDEQLKQGYARIWCLGLGMSGAPKHFVYGQTIREAYLRARRLAKDGQLGVVLTLGGGLRKIYEPRLRPIKTKKSKKTGQRLMGKKPDLGSSSEGTNAKTS